MQKPKLLPRHNRLSIMVLCSIILVILAGAAAASDNWWNKGKSLLDSLNNKGKGSNLTIEEIGAGLKEALQIGSGNVVNRLGRVDGFNKDSAVHIPLPGQLDSVKSALGHVGMSGLLDDLELKINRAAEVATPRAKEIFRQAIAEMRFEDVKSILNGPNDAATQYFRGKMSPSLADEMQPIVDTSLLEVGAIKAYDNTMTKYQSLPFVPDVKADLSNYVVQEGIEGIFYYMAREEAEIRTNPAKRTSELLQRLFSR